MSKIFYALLFLMITTMAWTHQAFAAEPSPATLREDLVKVDDSTFVIDKELRCQLRLPLSLGGGVPFNEFDMHVRFSAPASGLISRDKFVALSMRFFTEYRIRMAADIPGMTNEQTLKAMECRETQTPGTREYLFDLKMSSEGVESTITNKRLGTTHVITEPWSEVLRDQPKGN